MIKASELTKLYYSIGEVAKMFDVNTSLIRFWEKEFSSIKPKKNKKGNRLFTPDNILELQKIYQLVKIDGHTLEGAKKALKNGDIELKEAPPTFDQEALIESLESIKRKLIALKD
ncbi:MerR family transcriptional regulator [Brumimicrobium sp.]|uniref:MerR family transcriptional regulator n=1 Tax=Brumimicrobium sp. TaxID=2029867 RepID=UPI003A946F8E